MRVFRPFSAHVGRLVEPGERPFGGTGRRAPSLAFTAGFHVLVLCTGAVQLSLGRMVSFDLKAGPLWHRPIDAMDRRMRRFEPVAGSVFLDQEPHRVKQSA